MTPLLTISIPTYRRAPHLRHLLRALEVELAGLADKVEVIVSDNASPDETPALAAAFAATYPSTRIIRNAENIGADANIAQCFSEARGEYVWIMGDDDVPKSGAITQIVALLERERPDLVHLASEWLPEVNDSGQGRPVGTIDYRILERVAFARAVNVWTTFISGIIVSKPCVSRNPSANPTRFAGTLLIQLDWTLAALETGTRFASVSSPCVLATGGNTGGYAVLRTFAINLPRVVVEVFGRDSALYRAIVGPTVSGYLPQLAWDVRFAQEQRFLAEDSWDEMRRELGRFPAFWLLLRPVGLAPKPIARAALLAARAAAKGRRMLARLAGVRRQ